MRPLLGLLLVTALAACTISRPPRCCTAPAPPAARPEALHARADAFQSLIDTKLRPQWPYGALINLQFADPAMSAVTGFNDPQDSVIWTGIYAAAQAYRYAASSAPEKEAALAAVRDAVGALHTLATVPGYPGGLARIASPNLQVVREGCPNGIAPPCYQTNGVYWIGNTSRDQYTGWFFGMAAAHRLVDDPEVRATIAGDVRIVITAIHGWDYRIHGPDGRPNSGTAGEVHHQMRLSWHLIAATILDEPLYWEWYRQQTSLLDLAEADLEDAVDGTNVYYDYYGFNLGFLNGFHLVVLEPEPRLKEFYLKMLETQLYRYVRGTGNVFFDYMTMAASGRTSPQTLAEDRSSLASLPGPPSVWWCVQPPERPLDRESIRLYRINRDLSRVAKMEAFPQSATPYPLGERCRVNFIWQASPYKESCCCACPPAQGSCPATTYSPEYCSKPPAPQSGYLVYPGADYLVAYWMGRYYGFLDARE